jgi:peptide deformylase
MATLKIRLFPDPVLRQKARKVLNIDNTTQKLIDDMIETLHDSGGVGLAANQVGKLLKVAVIEVPESDTLILINPEVVKTKGECLVTEGCLSLPGYTGEIKRAESVKVKALDRQGSEIRINATELLAEALQHEIDHLNGILFIDHLVNPDGLQKLSAEE